MANNLLALEGEEIMRCKPLNPPLNMIYIGEFGHDPDEEGSLVLNICLHAMGLIKLVAVIANRAPAIKRARLALGTLTVMGYPKIPVIVGTGCGQTAREDDHVQFAASYLSGIPGRKFPRLDHFWEILEAQPDQSVVIVCASGLTDMYQLLQRNTKVSRERLELFRQKVVRVSIMGGVVVDNGDIALDYDGRVMPSWDATNNNHDHLSEYVYTQLQRMGVEFMIVSKHAAYAARVPRDVYDGLRLTNHQVGQRLCYVQRCMIQDLWERCNLPSDDPNRDGLPEGLNPKWFSTRFCDGDDLSRVSPTDEIWDYVKHFFLYDQLSVMMAVPSILEEHFEPIVIELANGGRVQVVGVDDDNHQIKDPFLTAKWLIEHMIRPLKHRVKRVASQ
jgi:hypothetical protein